MQPLMLKASKTTQPRYSQFFASYRIELDAFFVAVLKVSTRADEY
jgi:hypothetical protein